MLQKKPGTDVMSFPSSVQPQSGVSHVIGLAGGLVTRPVTSISKTHPPPSPPEELPLPDDEPLELPDEEPLELESKLIAAYGAL